MSFLEKAGGWVVSVVSAGPILKGLGSLWSKVMEDNDMAATAGEYAAKPTEWAVDKTVELGEKAIMGAGHAIANAASTGFENLGKLVPNPFASSKGPNGPELS